MKPRTTTVVILAVLVPTLLALALLVAACGSEATTLPTPNTDGTIAFARVVDRANADIYLVNTDGTGLRPLTETPVWDEDPSWSPDGSRIIYAAYSPESLYVNFSSVCVMNADGSDAAQLSKGYGFSPAWSPDGKQIVYVSATYTPPPHTPEVTPERVQVDVLVMNADGSGVRKLVGPDALPVAPSWGPKGNILFLRDGDLYSRNPDGSGEVRLTTGWTMGEYALSPDGKTLAYRDLAKDAVVARPLDGNGASVTLLEPATQFIKANPYAALAWAPDGRALAVAASSYDGRGGSSLYVVNADGSGLSQVPGIDAAFDPAWRSE